MGTSNYSNEFKQDAVHQITVRGYSVREVSRRLGVSKYSLYKWLKLFGDTTPTGSEKRCKTKGYAPASRTESNAESPSVARRYDRCPKVVLSAINLAAVVNYWL